MVSVNARGARKNQSQKPHTQPGVMGHPIRLKVHRAGHPPELRVERQERGVERLWLVRDEREKMQGQHPALFDMKVPRIVSPRQR